VIWDVCFSLLLCLSFDCFVGMVGLAECIFCSDCGCLVLCGIFVICVRIGSGFGLEWGAGRVRISDLGCALREVGRAFCVWQALTLLGGVYIIIGGLFVGIVRGVCGACGGIERLSCGYSLPGFEIVDFSMLCLWLLICDCSCCVVRA